MREQFDSEIEKAEMEVKNAQLLNPEIENESESESNAGDRDNEESDSEDIVNVNVNSNKRKKEENRFREHFSSKRRKLRCDRINGEQVQLFCHESPWGGRVDTNKLSKQQVLLEQPMGG